METAVPMGMNSGDARKGKTAKRQNTRSLIQILNSSSAREGKINYSAQPVKETRPGVYLNDGAMFGFIVDKSRLFESGRDDSWHILSGEKIVIERDVDGKPVALYPLLPKYSGGDKRIVESQEPFYVF